MMFKNISSLIVQNSQEWLFFYRCSCFLKNPVLNFLNVCTETIFVSQVFSILVYLNYAFFMDTVNFLMVRYF